MPAIESGCNKKQFEQKATSKHLQPLTVAPIVVNLLDRMSYSVASVLVGRAPRSIRTTSQGRTILYFAQRSGKVVEILRSSAKGEFIALQKWTEKSQQKLDLNFNQFLLVAAKPCTDCAGMTTGYETNMVYTINPTLGYIEGNIKPSCWDCYWKRKKAEALTGEKVQLSIEKLRHVDAFLRTVRYRISKDSFYAAKMRVPFTIGQEGYAEIALKPCHGCGQLGEPIAKLEVPVYMNHPTMMRLEGGFNKDNLTAMCSLCIKKL